MTSSVFVSFFLIFQKWIQFFYFWWIYWTFISFLTILDVKREKTSKTIWNDELKWFLNQKQFEERFLWCFIFRSIRQHLNFTHRFQKWYFLKKYVMTSSVFVSFFLIFQKWIQFFYFWWIYWTFISFLTILDVKREKTSKTIWNDELKWFLNQKQFEERFLWCSIFRTIPQHLNFTHSFQKWHLLKINFCFTK